MFVHVLHVQRTLIEIKMLTKFNHDNIIKIKDIIRADNLADMKEIYLVQDLMEIDLQSTFGKI